MSWSVKDLANKGFAQVDGGNYVNITKPLKKVAKPNVKVKNAVKSVNDEGVKFDSKLERYMYNLLKGAGIKFEFQYEYIIQPKFKYGLENIRAIKVITDFWLPDHNIVIDTKGFATAISKLKYKLLKAVLIRFGEHPEIYMPGTEKECDFLINKIKYGK